MSLRKQIADILFGDKYKATKEQKTTINEAMDNLYHAKCEATGELMNEGWCFGDGECYIANKKDAIAHCKKLGYKSLNAAYDDEVVYWSDWGEDLEEYAEYFVVGGKTYELN